MEDFTSKHDGQQVDKAVSGMLAYSGENSDNVRMASQIGLIPNDSTKGSANGAIIASLITAGKSLFMDKDETYYITGGSWEIGYAFSISGKATIIFSGTIIFKPVANCSISFDGITMRGQEPSALTYLIDNTTGINFFINRISLTNCEFGNFTRVVNVSGVDVDYSVAPFGIRDFAVENCRFVNSYTSSIVLYDVVISNRCTVRYNSVEKFKYSFFSFGNTNEYTYNDSNSYYNCELVFDSNVATGQVCDGNYAYCCFVLVEANKVVYTNNIVSNLIGVCGATYDMYANCYEIVYRGNTVRNVCNLPKNDDYTLYTEVFKSKSAGKKHVIGNYWMFDYNEIRQIASDAGYTYTDERFSQLSKVYLFQFAYTVDVQFCNNYIGIKNGDLRCAEASRPIRTMVCESNVIDVDGNMTGYLLPAWNEATQDIIVKNNVFRSNNTEGIYMFGNPSEGEYNSSARVVCKGNDSTVPILNVSTKSVAEFDFEGNTYKNLPTTFQNIWSTFNYSKRTKIEYFTSSDKHIVLYSVGNVDLTMHCKMTSGTPSIIYLKNGAYSVDLLFCDIKKVYKIRDDNGTYNVYNGYDVKVATIGTSYSNIIVEDSMYISAVYSNANTQIVLKYYNTTGWYDIEIADPSLNAFDGMISDNAIPIIAASGATLTAEIGRYYRYDSAVTSLAVTLPAVTDGSAVKSIILSLTTGSNPLITFTSADSSSISYQSGYQIEASINYEISCLFNGARWVIASMTIT